VNKILIGEPLDKTDILIVDEEGEILEDLGIGEIVVACGHISPGYWNNEESSKEKNFLMTRNWGDCIVPVIWGD